MHGILAMPAPNARSNQVTSCLLFALSTVSHFFDTVFFSVIPVTLFMFLGFLGAYSFAA
jgi:hypothetical protein